MSMEPQPPPPRPRAGPSGPRADFVPRLVGLLIDSVIVGLVNRLGDALTSQTVGFVLAVFVQLAYAVYFISSGSGQTPGMRVMRVRVLTASGGPPSVPRSLVRFAGLILAIVPLFAGFLPALFDARRRALQDFLAGTVVVDAQEQE